MSGPIPVPVRFEAQYVRAFCSGCGEGLRSPTGGPLWSLEELGSLEAADCPNRDCGARVDLRAERTATVHAEWTAIVQREG